MYMFTKLCRLCINNKDVASTLNNFDSDNIILLDKLNRIAPHLLQINNNLPIGICKSCITQLNRSYKFLQNCFHSQEILEEYLEQLQSGQYTEQDKRYEIVIKERKLEETNVIIETIEQINCNNVIIKTEQETDEEYDLRNSNDLRNSSVNYDNESNFMKQENVADDFDSIHVNFEDEMDIKHYLTNVKTEVIEEECPVIEEGYIDAIDIETDINVKTELEGPVIEEGYIDAIDIVKKELECPTEEEIALLTELKNEITEENHSENNINNDYFTDEDEIKIEGHESNSLVVNSKQSKYYGFSSAECRLANSISIKYNLELERWQVSVNEILPEVAVENSEINKRTANSNDWLQPGTSFKNSRSCEVSFSDDSTLKAYSQTRIAKKRFQCKICEKVWLSKIKLEVHKLSHMKLYKCETCNKSCSRKSSLKLHMRTHTQQKPYICEICNKSCSLKHNLKVHMRKHTLEKPYICEICNKSFSLNHNLKLHMQTHTQKKPYICEVCDKSFSLNGNLKTHMRTHTKEKPYNCEICNKRFTQKNNIKRHMRIHTKEKPYNCEICNKRFTQKNNLKRHMLTHTQEKPY